MYLTYKTLEEVLQAVETLPDLTNSADIDLVDKMIKELLSK